MTNSNSTVIIDTSGVSDNPFANGNGDSESEISPFSGGGTGTHLSHQQSHQQQQNANGNANGGPVGGPDGRFAYDTSAATGGGKQGDGGANFKRAAASEPVTRTAAETERQAAEQGT